MLKIPLEMGGEGGGGRNFQRFSRSHIGYDFLNVLQQIRMYVVIVAPLNLKLIMRIFQLQKNNEMKTKIIDPVIEFGSLFAQMQKQYSSSLVEVCRAVVAFVAIDSLDCFQGTMCSAPLPPFNRVPFTAHIPLKSNSTHYHNYCIRRDKHLTPPKRN